MAGAQAPALPTVRGGTQGTPESPSAKAITAPTEDNPEATAAEATGPIPVAETVSDDSVRRKLEGLLSKSPIPSNLTIPIQKFRIQQELERTWGLPLTLLMGD